MNIIRPQHDLKLYYNGVRTGGGPLERCRYYLGDPAATSTDTLLIWAYDAEWSDAAKRAFESKAAVRQFQVVVRTDSPLYPEVVKAYQQQEQRRNAAAIPSRPRRPRAAPKPAP
jgi:hypothetical protein